MNQKNSGFLRSEGEVLGLQTGRRSSSKVKTADVGKHADVDTSESHPLNSVWNTQW